MEKSNKSRRVKTIVEKQKKQDEEAFFDAKRRVDQKNFKRFKWAMEAFCLQNPHLLTSDGRFSEIPQTTKKNEISGKKEFVYVQFVNPETNKTEDYPFGRELKFYLEEFELHENGEKTSLTLTDENWQEFKNFFFCFSSTPKQILEHENRLIQEKNLEKLILTIKNFKVEFPEAFDENGRLNRFTLKMRKEHFSWSENKQSSIKHGQRTFVSFVQDLIKDYQNFLEEKPAFFDWEQEKAIKVRELIDFDSKNLHKYRSVDQLKNAVKNYVEIFPETKDEDNRLQNLNGGNIFVYYDEVLGKSVSYNIAAHLVAFNSQRKKFLMGRPYSKQIWEQDFEDVSKLVNFAALAKNNKQKMVQKKDYTKNVDREQKF